MGKVFSKKQQHQQLQQFTQQLRAFEEDHMWINRNLELLLSQYPEQWIAVERGQVIASDPDLMSLRDMVADPAHTCIEFITCKPLEMIL